MIYKVHRSLYSDEHRLCSKSAVALVQALGEVGYESAVG